MTSHRAHPHRTRQLMALQGSNAVDGPWTTLATFDYNTSPGLDSGCYSGEPTGARMTPQDPA